MDGKSKRFKAYRIFDNYSILPRYVKMKKLFTNKKKINKK